jgi:hypothetical protein
MSYVGNTPFTAAFLTDTFSGNGSTVAFTMSVAPATTSSVIVAITGVLQDPSTYSVSGTTLTFSAAPPTGTSNISVRYLGIPASGVTTTAYRTQTEFTATAGQTTFSVPSYTVGFIDVYRNGLLLGSPDFTATNGTTVVLTNAASAGDFVETVSFYVSSVLNALPNTGGTLSGQLNINSATGQKPLIAQVNGTQAFEVDASGNVGIGTASPSDTIGYGRTLDIQGSIGAVVYLRDSDAPTTAYGFVSFDGNAGVNNLNIANSSSAGPIRLITNGAERARINSSGSLLVGTISAVNNWNNSLIKMRVENGIQFGSYSAIAEDLFDADSLGICADSTENICFGQYNIATAAYTERARITAAGDFLVGKNTAAVSSGGNGLYVAANGFVGTNIPSSLADTFNVFNSTAAVYRFYVTQGGTIFATSTTISAISDQRLKENVQDLDVGLDAVMALKPRKFDWKEGKGKDIKGDRGFIAQEFEQVFPDMIDEWKDESPEGEDPYKSVRADLIPVLVKAIQEQQAIIIQLQADVAALKGSK